MIITIVSSMALAAEPTRGPALASPCRSYSPPQPQSTPSPATNPCCWRPPPPPPPPSGRLLTSLKTKVLNGLDKPGGGNGGWQGAWPGKGLGRKTRKKDKEERHRGLGKAECPGWEPSGSLRCDPPALHSPTPVHSSTGMASMEPPLPSQKIPRSPSPTLPFSLSAPFPHSPPLTLAACLLNHKAVRLNLHAGQSRGPRPRIPPGPPTPAPSPWQHVHCIHQAVRLHLHAGQLLIQVHLNGLHLVQPLQRLSHSGAGGTRGGGWGLTQGDRGSRGWGRGTKV